MSGEGNYFYNKFYQLHKNHLKEIFVPIRSYLKNMSNDNNLAYPYVFFKKHNIILNISETYPILTNFGKTFFFEFENYKDIKKIRLYTEENKYYYFWTCSNDFTKYYFKNHLKRRICLKNEDNSFISFNLNDYNYYNYSEYYLYPPKYFNYTKIIEAFLDLDWNNPPKELSFLIEDGKYYSDYKRYNHYTNNNFETVFHNQKIGVSLSLFFDMKVKYNNDAHILYLNIHHLFLKDMYFRKNYLLIGIYFNFKNYDQQYDKLLRKIFELLKDDERAIFIYFDDIHSIDEYRAVENIKKKLQKQIEKMQKKKRFL